MHIAFMSQEHSLEQLPRLLQIEELAGIGYGPREIARYLGEDTRVFLKEWRQENSETREAYDRGRLKVQAEIDLRMAQDAQAGNLTAVQIHKRTIRDREWSDAFMKQLPDE